MPRLRLTYFHVKGEERKLDLILQPLNASKIGVHCELVQFGSGQTATGTKGTSSADVPEKGDICVFVATPRSLESEWNRAEITTILNKMLGEYANEAQLIGIFLEPISEGSIPALTLQHPYVHLLVSDWAARVAAITQREEIDDEEFEGEFGSPFIDVHQRTRMSVVEVRPYLGRWRCCRVALPVEEKQRLLWTCVGPKGVIPSGGSLNGLQEVSSVWYIEQPDGIASTQDSLYIALQARPSALWFRTKHGMYLLPPSALEQVLAGPEV
jgi:hypothetical protein